MLHQVFLLYSRNFQTFLKCGVRALQLIDPLWRKNEWNRDWKHPLNLMLRTNYTTERIELWFIFLNFDWLQQLFFFLVAVVLLCLESKWYYFMLSFVTLGDDVKPQSKTSLEPFHCCVNKHLNWLDFQRL